MAKRLF
jgi:hypothetical protein